MDSQQLQNIFHMQGVNMRYLGEVATQTSMTHIKEICVIEMCARTLKVILNMEISRKILKHRDLVRELEYKRHSQKKKR
jgi:hypothetical protein